MKRPLLLRSAAALSLLTCLGHTVGTFLPVPPDQTRMLATLDAMRETMVPMPVGAARSYVEILDGNNFCTSLLLGLCATLLFVVSSAPRDRIVDRVVTVTALALLGISALSFRYFFPPPAIFTGLAALLAAASLLRGVER